jgi:hypothetical protein
MMGLPPNATDAIIATDPIISIFFISYPSLLLLFLLVSRGPDGV